MRRGRRLLRHWSDSRERLQDGADRVAGKHFGGSCNRNEAVGVPASSISVLMVRGMCSPNGVYAPVLNESAD